LRQHHDALRPAKILLRGPSDLVSALSNYHSDVIRKVATWQARRLNQCRSGGLNR
jgi:hypothetical protein